MKRILSKAYPVILLVLILLAGLEWLRAEQAVGDRYQGAPDGGIYGTP